MFCYSFRESVTLNKLVAPTSGSQTAAALRHGSWHKTSAMPPWDQDMDPAQKFSENGFKKEHVAKTSWWALESLVFWWSNGGFLVLSWANYYLVGGFSPTHLKNMNVKLDHLSR